MGEKSSRIASLDGLRGVACVIVLLMHLGLTVKPFGSDFSYLLMPGNAAVLIFFVLSGAVLSLVPLRDLAQNKEYSWFEYYPRRVVRLMLPLFVAVALGVLSVMAAQLLGARGEGTAIGTIRSNVDLQTIMHDITAQFDFLFAEVDRSNPPTWSMKWELWFSLLLPLYIYICSRTKRTAVAIAVIYSIICAAHLFDYLPIQRCLMFLVGVYLAKDIEVISKRRINHIGAILILAGCCTAIELPILLDGLYGEQNSVVEAAFAMLKDMACAGLVVLAVSRGVWNKFLSTRPCQLLGALSYSLYLTHAIVISALHVILGLAGMNEPLIQCLVILPCTLLVAYLFWRFIELPSIKLSHRIGKKTF